MVKIGIDARLLHYRTGGISTYTQQMLLALQSFGLAQNIHIFKSWKMQSPVIQNAPEHALFTPAHHRIERLALSIELLRHNLDIWHSPDFIPPYRGAKRHVITVHDLTFLHYPQYLTADSRRYYNEQIQSACDHADHILAVSETTKQDIISILNIPAEKITVQPHGYNARYRPMSTEETASVTQKYNLPTDYILHVGTLEPRKNIIGLLNAYHQVRQTMPDSPKLLLVGRRGWLFDETEREIERLNLHQHLMILSDVTDEELPMLYNLAHVVVQPSFYEGFGLPALEAMACETVPIVSSISSYPEVVADVGLQVDPHDTDSITQAIIKAYTDSNWYADMKAKTLPRAQTFSWQKSAQIAHQVYTSLL